MAFWNADADYVNEDGQTIWGREAIGACTKSLTEFKAGKSRQKSNLRFLTPDVAVMDGNVDVTSKDGATDGNHFSVWTRWREMDHRFARRGDTAAELADRCIHDLKWLIRRLDG